MATRKFLDFEGLQKYDELRRAEMIEADEAVKASLTGGTVVVAKATNADTATYATSAGSANTATSATTASKAGTATYASSAGTASKLGTATVGSATKPVYLNAGVATTCTTYAGGTRLTLNGTSKSGSSAAIFAPTAGGTSGQILKSAGTASAPVWADLDAYSKAEIDNKLASKSDTSHNHDSKYDAKGASTAALSSAKSYTDSAVATVKNDLLNGAGAAYDTLKELGDLIDDNADAIEALETIASGKANAEHGHEIADVTGLQTALDGKAASSHGTHVTWATNAPKMDGTASVGSVARVAREDHIHPIDTSRAAKTDLDTHVASTVSHITSSERTAWNAKASTASATTATAGLMSAADKAKLNGIAEGANKYTLPTATTATVGGVKSGSTVTSASGYTAAPIIGGIPYYKDTNTTYTGANGISLSGTTFSNAGVRSVVTGSSNGTIIVNTNGTTASVAVKGLAAAAYKAVDTSLSTSSTNLVTNGTVATAINTATSAIGANTSSIANHTTAITNLQTAVAEFEEIPVSDIQNLFA